MTSDANQRPTQGQPFENEGQEQSQRHRQADGQRVLVVAVDQKEHDRRENGARMEACAKTGRSQDAVGKAR